MLNVHLVAHTHDDVGWLKTVDQYYYGGTKATTDPEIQLGGRGRTKPDIFATARQLSFSLPNFTRQGKYMALCPHPTFATENLPLCHR